MLIEYLEGRYLINEYEKVLTELNPEFAEREQQKNEIKIIKDQMNTMSQNILFLEHSKL